MKAVIVIIQLALGVVILVGIETQFPKVVTKMHNFAAVRVDAARAAAHPLNQDAPADPCRPARPQGWFGGGGNNAPGATTANFVKLSEPTTQCANARVKKLGAQRHPPGWFGG